MNKSEINKILIVYHRFPPIAEDLKKAFLRLGVEAEIFYTTDYEHWFYRRVIRGVNRHARNLRLIPKGGDLFKSHPLNLRNYVSSNFVKAFLQHQPDAVLVIHGLPFGEKALLELKVPKIGWHIEPRDDLPYLIENARPFDIYYSYSQKDVDSLAAEGFASRYMSHAVDPERFCLVPNVTRNLDVTFVGNWSGWRDEVLQAALEVTENIALYGSYWLRKSKIPRVQLKKIYRGEHIFGEGLNYLYSASKIILNASRAQGSYGLNMRFFEVLATGGVLLTDDVPELEKLFVPGEHLLRYGDSIELKSILGKALNDQSMLDQVGGAGQHLVLEKHRYDMMAAGLLSQFETILKAHK